MEDRERDSSWGSESDKDQTGQASAEYERACGMIEAGRLEDALTVLQDLLDRFPGHREATNKAGVVLARLGQEEGAARYFQDLLSRCPDYVPALSNLGNIHYSKGEYERAIELYKMALKRNPDYAIAHNNLAAAYKKTGDMGKFVEHLKTANRLKLRSSEEEAREQWKGRKKGVFGCLVVPIVVVSVLIMVLLASF